MSFVAFALKQNEGPYGDLAMDMKADPQIKRAWGFDRLCRHLMDNHRPVERVWLTLEALKEDYDRSKAPKAPKTEFQGHPYLEET